MKRLLGAVAAVCLLVLALAGCGAHHAGVKAPPAAKLPAATQTTGCPVNHATMGCSLTQPSGSRQLSFGVPAGSRFPDVSSYQGHPNWAAAKKSISGAVFKIGEGSGYIDPDAAYNNAALASLGIPRVGYWFVRPDGCSAQGARLEAEAKTLGLKLVVLDEEVPGISGYAACLNWYVKVATGHDAVVYRSAGNNYDSSSPGLTCWVAAYGPSHVPACSHRAIKGWQMTDGVYGFPTYIPGVGTGDVSIDYGLFKLLPQPKPADPFPRAPNDLRTFGKPPHRVSAREHAALVTWRSHSCANPVRRTVCETARADDLLLARRIYVIASDHGKLGRGHRHWSRDHLGVRYQYFSRELAAR